jgi:hypothetical protein
MSDHTPWPRSSEPASPISSRFAERWSCLTPNEQRLVAMAIDAMASGEFTSAASWQRFVAASVELLHELDDGTVSIDEIHHVALEAAGVDDLRATDPFDGSTD